MKMDIAAEPTGGRWEGEKEKPFFLERDITPETKAS